MQNVKNFLDEVRREVHPSYGRVVWPDREKVIQSTWIVIGMSVLVSMFIWMADSSFGKIIQGVLFEG